MDCFAALAMTLRVRLHTKTVITREGGYPVRRGFSVLSSASLEYWVVRSRLRQGYDEATNSLGAPKL